MYSPDHDPDENDLGDVDPATLFRIDLDDLLERGFDYVDPETIAKIVNLADAVRYLEHMECFTTDRGVALHLEALRDFVEGLRKVGLGHWVSYDYYYSEIGALIDHVAWLERRGETLTRERMLEVAAHVANLQLLEERAAQKEREATYARRESEEGDRPAG